MRRCGNLRRELGAESLAHENGVPVHKMVKTVVNTVGENGFHGRSDSVREGKRKRGREGRRRKRRGVSGFFSVCLWGLLFSGSNRNGTCYLISKNTGHVTRVMILWIWWAGVEPVCSGPVHSSTFTCRWKMKIILLSFFKKYIKNKNKKTIIWFFFYATTYFYHAVLIC